MIIKESIKTDSPIGKRDHCMINVEMKLSLGIVSHILKVTIEIFLTI